MATEEQARSVREVVPAKCRSSACSSTRTSAQMDELVESHRGSTACSCTAPSRARSSSTTARARSAACATATLSVVPPGFRRSTTARGGETRDSRGAVRALAAGQPPRGRPPAAAGGPARADNVGAGGARGAAVRGRLRERRRERRGHQGSRTRATLWSPRRRRRDEHDPQRPRRRARAGCARALRGASAGASCPRP